MKKIILLVFVLFFLNSFAFALEFHPNTVKEMDLNLLMHAEGSFQGNISEQDRLELKFLTLNDSLTQEIISIEEKLLIGGDKIKAEHETEAGNKYAVFKINKLIDYKDNPEFKIEVNARLKTKALFELSQDHDLREKISGEDEFLSQTDFIESNDPQLRSKAELEFTGNSELETIKGIAEWVNKNISYDFENYYNGTWGAKHTYEKRAGVCDEFANLTAAFMRIKGIPAKYISGVSFDGKRFGNHGWNEVFLGGQGWIGVDSTYGEAGYLDAAHIVLGQGRDANELSNLAVTTWSVKPIQVQTTLSDPTIEVNSITFFENLVEVDLNFPESLYSEQDFQIKAKIKNLQNHNLILPLKLVLHDEFSLQDKSQLVLLKPMEEKEVTWNARAPKLEEKGIYLNYEMLFLSPDQNISETLKLYPEKTELEKKSNIQIIDISPFIEEENLRIEITAFNKGLLEGRATVLLTYAGETNRYEERIPEYTEKKLVYELVGVKEGKVLLSIKSDENKSIEILIPKKIVEKTRLEIKEVTGKEAKEIQQEEKKKTSTKITKKNQTIEQQVIEFIQENPLIAGASGIIALLLIILIVKNLAGF